MANRIGFSSSEDSPVPNGYRLKDLGKGSLVLEYDGDDGEMPDHYLCTNCRGILQPGRRRRNPDRSTSGWQPTLHCHECGLEIPVPSDFHPYY